MIVHSYRVSLIQVGTLCSNDDAPSNGALELKGVNQDADTCEGDSMESAEVAGGDGFSNSHGSRGQGVTGPGEDVPGMSLSQYYPGKPSLSPPPPPPPPPPLPTTTHGASGEQNSTTTDIEAPDHTLRSPDSTDTPHSQENTSTQDINDTPSVLAAVGAATILLTTSASSSAEPQPPLWITATPSCGREECDRMNLELLDPLECDDETIVRGSHPPVIENQDNDCTTTPDDNTHHTTSQNPPRSSPPSPTATREDHTSTAISNGGIPPPPQSSVVQQQPEPTHTLPPIDHCGQFLYDNEGGKESNEKGGGGGGDGGGGVMGDFGEGGGVGEGVEDVVVTGGDSGLLSIANDQTNSSQLSKKEVFVHSRVNYVSLHKSCTNYTPTGVTRCLCRRATCSERDDGPHGPRPAGEPDAGRGNCALLFPSHPSQVYTLYYHYHSTPAQYIPQLYRQAVENMLIYTIMHIANPHTHYACPTYLSHLHTLSLTHTPHSSSLSLSPSPSPSHTHTHTLSLSLSLSISHSLTHTQQSCRCWWCASSRLRQCWW